MARLQVGELVCLEITWGTQVRLKCPACQHYVSGLLDSVSCRCGAIYQATPQRGDYLVERVP